MSLSSVLSNGPTNGLNSDLAGDDQRLDPSRSDSCIEIESRSFPNIIPQFALQRSVMTERTGVIYSIFGGLLSAFVALVVAHLTALNAINSKVSEFKTNFEMGLFQARLEQYGGLLEILIEVSSTNLNGAQNPEDAMRVVERLNQWHHGPGGLVASAQTRGAVVHLRDQLEQWGNDPDPTAPRPEVIRTARDSVLDMARLDIGLVGRETWDFSKRDDIQKRVEDALKCMKDEVTPRFNRTSCEPLILEETLSQPAKN